MKDVKAPSIGEQHCRIEKDKNGRGIQVHCNHCDWVGGYTDPVVARRMASNHIVKLHRNIAQPAPKKEAANPRNNRRTAAEVRFCPCCGTNLDGRSSLLPVLWHQP